MAKGTLAKEAVAKKLAEAFGSDYIGEYDKKWYVWSTENGEKIQIAIAMTCPKTPVGAISATPAIDAGGDFDFENMNTASPVEITVDEKKNIEDLMNRLGL